jgi:hypothetical protein
MCHLLLSLLSTMNSGLDGQGLIPRDVSLLHSIQTSFGGHVAFCRMTTRVFFTGREMAEK